MNKIATMAPATKISLSIPPTPSDPVGDDDVRDSAARDKAPTGVDDKA
jgi:hypothetical protein